MFVMLFFGSSSWSITLFFSAYFAFAQAFPTYSNLTTPQTTYISNTLQSSASQTRNASSTVADSCQASMDAYSAAYDAYYTSLTAAESAGSFVKTTFTSVMTVTETVPTYSLSAFDTVWVENSASLVSSGTVSTWLPFYSPVQESYAFWTSHWTTLHMFTDTQTAFVTPSFSMKYPNCTAFLGPVSGSCGACTFDANQLQLIYWPVKTVSGNRNSTITPTATEVPTGTFNGTAYASGKVYLKYEKVAAFDNCGPVGNVYPGAVVTLQSNEVSSLVGDGTYFGAVQSFNYADLNYPYPWSAFARQMGCVHNPNECPFVSEGGYNPFVSIPPQIRDLDPAWASCTINALRGSWDPPYALTSAADAQLTGLAPPNFGPTPAAAAGSPINPIASPTVAPPLSLPPSATAVPSKPSASVLDPPVVLLPTPDPSSRALANPGDPAASSIPPQLSGNLSPSIQTSKDPGPSQVQPQKSNDPSATTVSIPEAPNTPAPQTGQVTITQPAILTFAGSTYTANPSSNFIIGSQTLSPGSQITISGTTLSLDPPATAVVIASTTVPLHPSPPSPSLPPPVLTFAGTVYTANPLSAFIIGSQTLIPGGQITISSTVLSLDPSATALILPSTTIPLHPPSPFPSPLLLTLAGTTYTANSLSAFVLASQTLTLGGEFTFSGQVISLSASATEVLVGGSTTVGLGAAIISAFGPIGGPAATATETIGVFTGGAVRGRGGVWWSVMIGTLGVAWLMIGF